MYVLSNGILDWKKYHRDGMLTYVTHVNQQVWTIRNWFRPDDTQILSSGTRY